MDLLHYEEKPQTRTGYFWWSVFILLLTGGCFASWIGCFYVVSHPENPRCYRFLKKIKRLDPPKRFKVGHGDLITPEVPHGDFLTVTKLLERFGKLGPEELAQENARMLRGYLMNFREAKKRMVDMGGKMVAQQDVVYVVGRFDIVASHVLGPTDLFPTGVVAVAQSLEAPQLLLEAIFPAQGKTARALQAALPIGGNLQLERSLDLLAVLHVERASDGHLQFTAIPLPYGMWQTKRRDAFFHIKSPEELEKEDPKDTLNITAGLPVVRGERLQKDLAAYVEHRRKLLADGAEEEAWAPTLVRFDPSRDETDSAVSPRVVRDSTPSAVRPAVVAPGEDANDGEGPVALPSPAPAIPATVTNPPVSPTGSSQVPRRVVAVKEAIEFANNPSALPPAVLAGDFLVSGVDGRHAQLRAPADAGGKPPIVLVEFPAGTTLPSPGTSIRRLGARGFVIKSVVRGANGQVVIVATEQAP